MTSKKLPDNKIGVS